VIVQEAGGRATDFDGGSPVVGRRQLELVATNGRIHNELLGVLRKSAYSVQRAAYK
jgi:fructose-1,6-bisphosphatase/inositol monophosphatase family enzyme